MNERSVQQLTEELAVALKPTEAERNERLPSGRQPVFRNRVGWANTYMKKAGLLSATKRGWVKITEAGLKVLTEKPKRIDVHFLERFPQFVAFRELRHEEAPSPKPDGDESTIPPFEQLELAYARMQADLQDDLLGQVKAMSPAFFEQLVVDLLVKMGYGGNFRDAARAIGRSRDAGIDGIIKEDKLGLDTIYLQAKRWANPVGRPEIQKFAGALQGKRARKGVFITTSGFTDDAVEYALAIDRIVLIDGAELARLMVEYGLGVTHIESYELKKIDTDYFAE